MSSRASGMSGSRDFRGMFRLPGPTLWERARKRLALEFRTVELQRRWDVSEKNGAAQSGSVEGTLHDRIHQVFQNGQIPSESLMLYGTSWQSEPSGRFSRHSLICINATREACPVSSISESCAPGRFI